MRGVSFSMSMMIVTAITAAACDPATPDLHELECGKLVYGVEAPPDGQCLRVDTYEGARARSAGTEDGCDSWTECLVLPGGESAERAGNPLDPGHVVVTYWPCDKIPACELYAITVDGTAVLRP